MQIKDLPEEFEDARKILQMIEEAGFEAYFVGGSVRDTLLGLPIHDVDIATSAYPSEIKDIFKRTIDTGIEHGTVTVMFDNKGFEITTFRTESGYQDYRRPDSVKFVRSLSEDLKRRDFTINALAMKENGEVIDLFNGLDDLNNHLIKAVGNPDERFNEDALRMMRAVRFGSQLNFSIEPRTFKAIKKSSYLLNKIAIERIRDEFVKMILGLDPNRGLSQMIETDLIKYVPVFSEFVPNLRELGSKDIHSHIQNETQVWSMLAVVCGIEKTAINKMMKSWKWSNRLNENVRNTVFGVAMIQKNNLTDKNLYRLTGENLINAVKVSNVFGDYGEINHYTRRFKKLPIKSKKDLQINGKQLMDAGVEAGPQIGRTLTELEDLVVTGKLENDFETLKDYAIKFVK